MKKAIAILAAAVMAAIAGQVWYEVDGKRYETNVIPYSKLKNKVVQFGIICKKPSPNSDKYYSIKTVIHQENPCYIDAGINAHKIDDHTVYVYNLGYYAIGDETEIDPKLSGRAVLGTRGCEKHYKGKETWTIYYEDNGQWKYGCEGTFIFK